MKQNMKKRVDRIVDGKLTTGEIEELINFFQYVLSGNMDQDDDNFFRNLTYEMTGSVKELALLIIDFKENLKSKIQPEITDIATKYIPRAADQLESIIETTEMAANKIMDNLDFMQEHDEKMEEVFTALKGGKLDLPGSTNGVAEIDDQTIDALLPLIDYVELNIQNHLSLISDTFVQMSFQDLTGQRIRRIMNLVNEMEQKIKKMIVSFGIQLSVKEKNPDVTEEELHRAVAEKETELTGPQRAGDGLDQGGIDELLANL